MLHLAVKAFWPAPVPFPVMHVDTGRELRRGDRVPRQDRREVRPAADRRRASRTTSTPDARSRRPARTPAATGCRRSRCCAASARTSSARCSAAPAATRRRRAPRSACSASATSSAPGTPATSVPELWNLYNGRHKKGENIRVFPLSNWTELDIWNYIRDEQIELPPLYYAHTREVVERDGMLLAVNRFIQPRDGETPFEAKVRFRTIGDATCTGLRRVVAPPPRRRSPRRSPPPASPSVARPAPTTASPRPAWKTARKRATSK